MERAEIDYVKLSTLLATSYQKIKAQEGDEEAEKFNAFVMPIMKKYFYNTQILEKDATKNVFPLLAIRREFSKNGEVKVEKVASTVRNYELILENDIRFAGKIKFDTFKNKLYLVGDVPWESIRNFREWKNLDDTNLFAAIEVDYGIGDENKLAKAIKNVSHRNEFNQVVDLLDPLEHEETGYIRKLLVEYLGAEDSDYNYEVMKLFMLGSVARAYTPGCKFDYCPVLSGKQGVGKSTFIQCLAMDDSLFNDSLDSLDGDKCRQVIQDSWINELAELKSFARTKGGFDSIKSFITARQDIYRLPYERRVETFLRHCTFIGTTNEEEFLRDETGNRRFLVVKVGVRKPVKSIFDGNIMDDIKKAWGEAVHIFKTQNPVLELPEYVRGQAQEYQKQALPDDGLLGLIEAYIDEKNLSKICAVQVWQEVLGHFDNPPKFETVKINKALSKLDGWEKVSTIRFGKFGTQRGYKRKQNDATINVNNGVNNLEYIEKSPFDG